MFVRLNDNRQDVTADKDPGVILWCNARELSTVDDNAV